MKIDPTINSKNTLKKAAAVSAAGAATLGLYELGRQRYIIKTPEKQFDTFVKKHSKEFEAYANVIRNKGRFIWSYVGKNALVGGAMAFGVYVLYKEVKSIFKPAQKTCFVLVPGEKDESSKD